VSSSRNPQGIREIILPVAENDYVHNDMSCWGEYNWTVEPGRKEVDIVGSFNNITDEDLQEWFESITHKTFSGFAKAKDYPIPRWTDYESSRRVELMHNSKHAREFSKIAKLCDTIGFEESLVNFQIQVPGQMTPLHTDQLYKRRGEGEYAKDMHRILITLSDWSYGQVFQFGNETVTHWNRGDICVNINKNAPHGGANFGMLPRIFLNITGLPTKTTYKNFPRLKDIDLNHQIVSKFRSYDL
jgi:hypothetical protein